MTSTELRMSASVTLAIEYGHFTVADQQLDDPAAGSRALDKALESPARVGAVRNVVAVLTPACDTYETPIALEVWSARPPTDAIKWDHEVEVDLLVPSGRLAVCTATSDPDIVEGVAPGSYRLLVSGGRFDPMPAMADSEQHFRLRLWPRPSPAPLLVVRSWPGWADF
ncbi:hypothetical protein [Actinoplanes sp. NPDC049599]|uniref:hypothetical protein n=1 Tax=Actinoplanes sp. NPDC049599 TaxID=3363903 RepID=UPI0037936FB5